MKRSFVVLIALALWMPAGFAQEAPAAVATETPTATPPAAAPAPAPILELPADVKETLDLLKSNVRNLMADAEESSRKMSALQKELESVRAELAKFKADTGLASAKFVTQTNLEEAVRRILESVDQRRDADRLATLEAITNLLTKLIPPPALATNSPPPASSSSETNAASSFDPKVDTVIHEVKPGQVFGAIVKIYNDKYKELGLPPITQADVLRLNPEVTDPNKLAVGQKLKIPVPAKP